MEIKKLNEKSTNEAIMNVVEFDLKENTAIGDYKDSIEKFFKWKVTKNIIHCEKDIANLEMYKELGWLDTSSDEKLFKQTNFDIINSFINIYTFALLIFYPNKFSYVDSYKSVKVKNIGRFQNANSLKYLTGNTDDGRKTFESFLAVNNLKCILELAQLTHTIGNFMPCPPAPYNTAKGLCNDVKDFFDLMFVKINDEKLITYSVSQNGKYIPKRVDEQDIKKWKEWFKENKKDIFIDDQDYQLISNVDDFQAMNIDSFIEMILIVNNRIRIRGLKMVKYITSFQEVKDRCDEIIKNISEV